MKPSKFYSLRTVAVAALIAGCGAAQAQANLLVNGSFELGSALTSGYSALGNGDTTMTGWTVVGDDLAWFHSTFGSGSQILTANDGAKFLDLTNVAPGCAPCGGVEQTIATTPGETYTLSFDLGSSSTYLTPAAITATLQVVVGGTVSQAFTSTAAGVNNWQTFSQTFVAANTNTTVRLVGSFAQQDYVGLDNVSVVAATPVPEPGALALMLAGLAAVGSVVSRRSLNR